MNPKLKVNISGIKCDNKECNYSDMSVQVEEYIDYLNKPCPECGSTLLTQTDYDNVQTILGLNNQSFGNKVENELKDCIDNLFHDSQSKTTINMDGSGKIEVNMKITNKNTERN